MCSRVLLHKNQWNTKWAFREKFISSHVKITCYLHTWRDHRRYGYIMKRAFESKLIWYFTGVYIINRILHTHLWIWILSSCVQLDISRVSTAHSWDIKLILHVWACNILYLSCVLTEIIHAVIVQSFIIISPRYTSCFFSRTANTIGHFGKYHNTLCLSPQILHKHCFQFLLGITMARRENKNNAYAKFGGTNKEYFPNWPMYYFI